MILRPPRSTRTDTLFPSTTLSDLGADGLVALSCRGLRATMDGLPTAASERHFRFPHDAIPSISAHLLAARCLKNCRNTRSQRAFRSEEHTSELQSLMRHTYAVFCLRTTHKNYDNSL